MTTTQWDAVLAKRVGSAIKGARENFSPKLSAARLADKTRDLGFEVTKASISDLELGRKKTVTVAELAVLAAALRIPPLSLVYPELPYGSVEVLPGVAVPSIDALRWFSGELRLDEAVPDVLFTSIEVDNTENLQFSRRLEAFRAAQEEMDLAVEAALILPSTDPGKAEKIERSERRAAAVRHEVESLIEEGRRRGWPVDG